MEDMKKNVKVNGKIFALLSILLVILYPCLFMYF